MFDIKDIGNGPIVEQKSASPFVNKTWIKKKKKIQLDLNNKYHFFFEERPIIKYNFRMGIRGKINRDF